jgi:hypothetical protein
VSFSGDRIAARERLSMLHRFLAFQLFRSRGEAASSSLPTLLLHPCNWPQDVASEHELGQSAGTREIPQKSEKKNLKFCKTKPLSPMESANQCEKWVKTKPNEARKAKLDVVISLL